MKKSLSFVVAALLTLAVAVSGQDEKKAEKAKGDAAKGKELFEQCSVCHNPDTEEKKMGPGLKGLFKKEKMANGKKPTEENVKAVINEGGNGMPPYLEMLTDEEREHVLAYLKTL